MDCYKCERMLSSQEEIDGMDVCIRCINMEDAKEKAEEVRDSTGWSNLACLHSIQDEFNLSNSQVDQLAWRMGNE